MNQTIRKIIEQGSGAHTITLPKAWINENNLNIKNSKVIISQRNKKSLMIQPFVEENNEIQEVIKSISLELDLDTKESYRSIIGSLYRFGYDEMHISYEDSNVFTILEKSINSIFGLELFYENDTNCLIKSIYSHEKTHVYMHIQRMVFSINAMHQIIIEDIEESNFKSKSKIKNLRDNTLKQRDLVLRIIKKQQLLDDDIFPFYTISLSLWSICRNYYHMYLNIEKNDFKYLNLLTNAHEYFSNSFNKLYNTNEKKLLKDHELYSKNFEELTNQLTKSKMLSFSLNIVIETQLAQSALYILSKK